MSRVTNEDGTIGHAAIRIGDAALMLADEWPEMKVLSPATLGGNSVSFVLATDDVDAAFDRAVRAGGRVERAVKDEPYGRAGWVIDPFGHRWCIM